MNASRADTECASTTVRNEILDAIRSNIVGQYQPFETPFGRRPLVYADYTASGRALHSLENVIRDQVLPTYANTHSESSHCGARSTAYRDWARQAVAAGLGCSDADKVIFCGSGATAAINKMIDILNLRLPKDLDGEFGLSAAISQEQRPVVFIGPYEHHSNELPWRETIAEVVSIPLNRSGAIDGDALEAALRRYAERPLRIGSFSAASNVTGIRSDVQGLTRLLKQHGALAFWDYAAAGPYVEIDMNRESAAIDAVFISPHKFIGGPGTPGILAVKAELLQNTVPATVGGGTVSFVAPGRHRYSEDPERREEAGTPAIVESIRAGLVFDLKAQVGEALIEEREQRWVQLARERFATVEELRVLGPSAEGQLPIFSLQFLHGSQTLHYGFVVALLNDLFGIQARGGCSCAGPYGHSLLGIDEEESLALERAVAAGQVSLRPGWVRLNFNYFIDDAEFSYLLDALTLVAREGWRLLPAYRLDPASGIWRYRGASCITPAPLRPLKLGNAVKSSSGQMQPQPDFAGLLSEALQILQGGPSESQLRGCMADCCDFNAHESLRWFPLPAEVAQILLPGREHEKRKVPSVATV